MLELKMGHMTTKELAEWPGRSTGRVKRQAFSSQPSERYKISQGGSPEISYTLNQLFNLLFLL